MKTSKNQIKQEREEKVRAQKNKTQKKESGKGTALILTLLILAIGVCGYKLYQTWSVYQGGIQEYTKTKENVTLVDDQFHIDFDALKSINQDTAAWIQFTNPAIISYPVTHTTNNKYYLHHTFEKKSSSVGAIFIDSNNTNNFQDDNTIVYGHNLKNGTMFAALKEYRDVHFYKENPFFYLYTPDGVKHTYQIYGVYEVMPDSNIYTYAFGNESLKAAYIKEMEEMKLYDTGITPAITDRMVTLSTCTDSGTRRVVVQGIELSR